MLTHILIFFLLLFLHPGLFLLSSGIDRKPSFPICSCLFVFLSLTVRLSRCVVGIDRRSIHFNDHSFVVVFVFRFIRFCLIYWSSFVALPLAYLFVLFLGARYGHLGTWIIFLVRFEVHVEIFKFKLKWLRLRDEGPRNVPSPIGRRLRSPFSFQRNKSCVSVCPARSILHRQTGLRPDGHDDFSLFVAYMPIYPLTSSKELFTAAEIARSPHERQSYSLVR